MKRILLFALLLPFSLFAHVNEKTLVLDTQTGSLEASWVQPDASARHVALLIAGSGPTDRDGNSPVLKNNMLKMLAYELSNKGIASLRFDKRGVGRSASAGGKEVDLRFESYVQDVLLWVEYLRKVKKYQKITIVGHSEGALIGMLAAKRVKVDGYVSLAASAIRADKLIEQQLSAQSQAVAALASPVLDQLVKGQTVDKVPDVLQSLFRPSAQPYLISWLNYDPAEEMTSLNTPCLIIHGENDIQVDSQHATILHNANKASKVIVVRGMNHILKPSGKDPDENYATYNNPGLALVTEAVDGIADFILSIGVHKTGLN